MTKLTNKERYSRYKETQKKYYERTKNLHPRIVFDLTGQVFGRWTILHKIKDKLNEKLHVTKFWKCVCECGNEGNVREVSLTNGLSNSCGCLAGDVNSQKLREKNPNWKGGKHTSSKGYVFIYDREHKRAKSNGYVLEHLVVMEKKIGRELNVNENVHHINGIRDDNRPENLELWSRSHPCGQRVYDKIIWAKEILKLYGNDEKKYKE